MSLFAELRRRNVFRVGIAYLVGAWLLLQLTDVLSELLNLPETVGPLVVTVVAIGFPIVLFAAWAFELTPEGIKRESEVDRSQSITPQTGRRLNVAIFTMLLVALTYFIWESRFAERTATPAAEDDPVTETVAPTGAGTDISRQSIAVLPFDNRSRLAEDEPFVEGVHDDLLTSLARIRDLKVISRTSVAQYAGTTKTIPEIAAELGVSAIMEGAVQRAGDTIRINVQLIDARTDEHLWASIYDRQLTAQNLFAIQSEISEAIAGALEATLTDAEQARIQAMPTDNLQAYDAYVRGRQLMVSRDSGELEKAAREFQRAVELDPEFALAWVGVADSHDLWSQYGTLPRDESFDIREDAIDRALAIDPLLGEAWASRGSLLQQSRRFEASEEAFLRAIELSPNYATAYHWYGSLLARYELRADERVAMMEKAAELDPRSPIIGATLAGAYEGQGRYLRAERQLLDVLDQVPDFTAGLSRLAGLYRNMGRLAESMMLLRRAESLDPGNPGIHSAQFNLYIQLDMLEEAERKLEDMRDRFPGWIGNDGASIGLSILKGNSAGALEIARSVLPRIEKIGGDAAFIANIYFSRGEFQQGRDWMERTRPAWTDPAEWRRLIEEYDAVACQYAWALIQTGDEEKGRRLVDQALRYLTEELPAVDEHADRLGVGPCYTIAGEIEAAYDSLETILAHNHLIPLKLAVEIGDPLIQPLLGTERMNAILAEFDRRIAEQRALLAELEAETAS